MRCAHGGEDCQVGDEVIGGILLANTVMGAAAKGQEVALEGDVLFALGAEAVRVKHMRVRVTLQIPHAKYNTPRLLMSVGVPRPRVGSPQETR